MLAAIACEVYGRPEQPSNIVASLLPRKTPTDAKERAQVFLDEADTLYNLHDYESASKRYTDALRAAPTNWKRAQAALIGRERSRKSVILAGNPDPVDEPSDAVKQWVWGRGLRWPFHYLIALILARPLFETTSTSTSTATSTSTSTGVGGSSAAEEKARAEKNLVVQILLAIGVLGLYNGVLLNYGLDY
eukprot:CAMPEP_0167805320 /NCGR_PEP_ID=MMETSP0111_2-20121227/21107_1 /TAXON_ID=91324 /ORGANISM="Lotharella globosa, Strain CCCM811" /LENGTH=189 /DNA_ID=CAMNT_0007702449 /DNA_START=314 /DNA_END=883 /DNA_ORIENTATION=+